MDHILLTVTLELMVTSIQATPAGFIGCFDDAEDRTLGGYHIELNPNGAHYCSTLCKVKGFRYAGTEFSSFCFCGNEFRRTETSSLHCDYPCTNNVNETCGGKWKISIYDTWQTTMGFLGCFVDKLYYRTLNELFEDYMNPNGARYCTELCMQNGYRYAGTEFAYECHCGNTIQGEETSITECNDICTNNVKESCGGSFRISIYDTWQATTTVTSSTTPSTTTAELPTTTDLVDITETTFDTNMVSSTSLYEKQTETEDQAVLTTYIYVACGVVVMVVVVVVVVLLICRRRKTKAGTQDEHVMRKSEHSANQTKNYTSKDVSFINVDTPSRSTTLYDNEHVIMTADGEHVNIEFHATQPPGDCGDYNTLCLSGKSDVPGFASSARPNQVADGVKNTYSHLNEHNNKHTSNDTYSQGTRNRLLDKSNESDDAYSHLGQTATQSETIENGMSPDGVYNTLDTLPKTTGRTKNLSDFKAISNNIGNQVYSNISTTYITKAVGLDEDNYSHILDSKRSQFEPKKGIQSINYTPNIEDNIYAKVDKKPNRIHDSENTYADQSKPRCNVDENTHGYNYYNTENIYYNV